METERPFQMFVRGRELFVRMPDGSAIRYERWRDIRRRHRHCCRECPYWSWVLPEDRR